MIPAVRGAAADIDIPSTWELITTFGALATLFAFAMLWLRGKIERRASADERIAAIQKAADDRVAAAEKERDRALALMNEFKSLAFAQSAELIRAQAIASEATVLAFRKPGAPGGSVA